MTADRRDLPDRPALEPKRIAEAEHKVLAFLATMVDVGYSGAEIWGAVDLTRAKLAPPSKP